VVDAGDDQLGLELDEAERREPDTVHRRAVGGEARGAVAEVDLLDPQRAPRGDAARGGAAVRVRRYHGQLDVGQRLQGPAHVVQACRLDSVVVREQDFHGASYLTRTR
jgi:hypothetical protein